MCAVCENYPCEHFIELMKGCPIVKQDNELYCEKGMEAWGKLQDERIADGFVYKGEK